MQVLNVHTKGNNTQLTAGCMNADPMLSNK